MTNGQLLCQHLPHLGVGVTYAPDLHELIASAPALFDVVEIEPQTLWIRDNNTGMFEFPQAALAMLDALPQTKIIHSVGVPVGGNKPADPHQLALLRDNIVHFNAPWASEHLSFNSTLDFHTGFFLPPRQTERGIANAVSNIKILQQSLKVPMSVETGVNYLQVRGDEMPDGQFVAEVSELANCGILLDLHNLYTNELNHRQTIDQFLQQIPLDRVWEVHLAGGIEMDGYWLDAHSGAIPQRLIDISREIVPHFPNLRAIIFEILPSYIPLVGFKTIRTQLETIKTIWEESHQKQPGRRKLQPALQRKLYESGTDDTLHWENTLGSIATGLNTGNHTAAFNELSADKGVAILQTLIGEFRASMIVSMLKLSSRYLMLSLGTGTFESFLYDFYNLYSPKQFGTDEAANFTSYLRSKEMNLPILYELLNFEEAVIATLVDGQVRTVTFTHDPVPLLSSLFNGRLPEVERKQGNYEIDITPDAELVFTDQKVNKDARVIPGH